MTVLSGGANSVGALDGTQALLLAMYLGRTGSADRRPPGTPPRSFGLPVPVGHPGARGRTVTHVAGSVPPDRPQVALGRAVSFIERHPRDPIRLAEIARAAGLSPRALQMAFRRHLDTTPLGYLRSVRLARVHADLQSAQPGDGRTVSTIASSWGFDQLSRFARDYRRYYGEAPHDTLASVES